MLLLLVTVQTLNRELLMTHVVPLIDVVMLRRRSLNLHSCAGGSPLVPGCCGAGCVDCHYGNGDVHGDEDDGNGGWGALGWHSRGSATPDDNFIGKGLDTAKTFPIEVLNVVNQNLLSYLLQRQVVGGSSLGSTPPFRPLHCAPSMLRGG